MSYNEICYELLLVIWFYVMIISYFVVVQGWRLCILVFFLQLCIDKRVLIFQLWRATIVPQDLRFLLNESNMDFTGFLLPSLVRDLLIHIDHTLAIAAPYGTWSRCLRRRCETYPWRISSEQPCCWFKHTLTVDQLWVASLIPFAAFTIGVSYLSLRPFPVISFFYFFFFLFMWRECVYIYILYMQQQLN